MLTLTEIVLTVNAKGVVSFYGVAMATIENFVGVARHTAGGTADDGHTAVAVVSIGMAEEVAAVSASVVVAAFCKTVAAIHSPMLFCCTCAAADGTLFTIGSYLAGVLSIFKTLVNDTCFTATGAGGAVRRYLTGIDITAIHINEIVNDSGLSATGAGGGDFFMTVVALANGLTADKAGVVVATVTAITATTCTFHVIAFRYADVVTARKLVMCFSNSAAGGAMIFILTFIVVALTKQVTANDTGIMGTAVADVCKASGALVVIASLAGLVITV